jgi:hypothetical protein
MNGKVLKTAVLIFGILLVVLSLISCDRVKASIGFKWGQVTTSDRFCELKNSQKEIDPAADMKQNVSIVTGSGTVFSGPFESPV